MMEDEVVVRRRWVTRERFLDLLGVANLLPGPSSSEMAIYLGYVRAGWPGLVVGGTCFVVPAAVIVVAFAWTYMRFGSLPETTGLLYGIRPVVVAIVVQAVWRLGRAAIADAVSLVVGVAAAGLSVAGLSPVVVLAVSGLAMVGVRTARDAGARRVAALLPLSPAGAAIAGGASVTLASVFLVFLKIGALVFGSGYVLLAFLRADLVERLHWLSERQLLDAVAIGQVTPGPVFTTATFIGYVVAGWTGAAVATVAIFLPAFFLVAASGPLIPLLRRSRVASFLLDGVTVGAVALMSIVTWQLGRVAVVDVTTATILVTSAVLLVRSRLESMWLIAAGAGIGIARGVLGAP